MHIRHLDINFLDLLTNNIWKVPSKAVPLHYNFKTISDMQNLISRLGVTETYDPKTQNCWPFKRSNDVRNGIPLKLSNMCGGFEFDFNGDHWKSSEVLYLCGEYSTGTDKELEIQKELIAQTSGYAAKRFIKAKYKDDVRKDFTEFRLQWMLFVVWQKCLGSENFRRLLGLFPSSSILIEDTTTDTGGTASIWGCSNKELTQVRKERENELNEWFSKTTGVTKKEFKDIVSDEINKILEYGTWVGENNIGKILMICRDCLRNGTEPEIDYELLRSKNIYILGKKLTF